MSAEDSPENPQVARAATRCSARLLPTCPASSSATTEQKQLVGNEGKEVTTKHTTFPRPEAALGKVSSPSENVKEKEVEAAPREHGHAKAGGDAPLQRKEGAKRAKEKEPEDEEDSDDSEVSDMYEEDPDEEEDEEEDDDPSNASGPSGDFRCTVCCLQLPSKFKLQDHMNLHTGARPYCCAECGKRFCQTYNYRVHLRTHAKTKVDRHWCRICLMGFSSQDLLDSHLNRVHLEETFYECDLCKRVFTCLKTCEKHVELHKSMLNIACEVCGRRFSSEKSLARHKKKRCLRHYKCTDCGQTFAKKNALLKHSFSHLGLLPYTCIRCRCHFRLAKLYRKHKCEVRIHCVACLREFPNQEDFQQHKKDTGCWGQQEPQQKTNEIRCLECGQKFGTTEELKKHAGAHQRVLKCAECGKGFRSALLLMSHMGGHAGQSPCLCQVCGLGFPHQQNYDSHLKTCSQTAASQNDATKLQTQKSFPQQNLKKKLRPNPSPTNTPTPAVTVADTSPTPPAAPHDPDAASSSSSDGLWRLTLDKEPPPGANLVLFLPVCPSSGELSLPPDLEQAPNIEFVTMNAALAVSLNPTLEQSTELVEEDGLPLDLSNKGKPSEPLARLSSVKREPEEFEVSGQTNGSVKEEDKRFDASDSCLETNGGKEDPTFLPDAGLAPTVKEEHPPDLGFTPLPAGDGLHKSIKHESNMDLS